jgi:hypothetical protein
MIKKKSADELKRSPRRAVEKITDDPWIAEAERFELSVPCGTPPFQGGALDHYATLPFMRQYTAKSPKIFLMTGSGHMLQCIHISISPEPMQKLLLPFSVVIAGALIAGTILFVNVGRPVTAPATTAAAAATAWVYRHFPIPQLHPKGPKEAEALECATAQGGNDMFWKYTDAIYAKTSSNNSLDDGIYNTPTTPPTDANGTPYYTQKKPRSATDAGALSDIAVSLGLDKAKFEDCLAKGTYASRVSTDEAEAIANNGQGTPHSVILVGNQQIPVEGSQPYEVLKGLIDSILK